MARPLMSSRRKRSEGELVCWKMKKEDGGWYFKVGELERIRLGKRRGIQWRTTWWLRVQVVDEVRRELHST
jgi:hypothetical protein